VTQRTIHLPRRTEGVLRPCPFCGGPATLEPDPRLDECLRVACGNQACRIAPRTEPLLACFVDELIAAWNERPGIPAGGLPTVLCRVGGNASIPWIHARAEGAR